MSELHVSVELPVLDLSQPVDLSFLSSLSQACQEWGFFYVTNHGILNLFSKVYSFLKHNFSLPPDSNLSLDSSSCLKTYTPHFIAAPYFESLIVSGPDFFASAKRSADELYSQRNPELSEILQEYGNKTIKLSKKIIEVLLMTLGDGCDRKFCESEFSNFHGYFRIVNYSPPKDVEEKEVEGLGMHFVIEVILAPDEVVGEGNQRIYKSFVCWDYLEFRKVNLRKSGTP